MLAAEVPWPMIFWTALALAADRVEGAASLATGSTGVANPHTQAGITANPGVIGLTERYTYGGGFSYADRGIHWNASAIDTRTSPAAFGLAYSGDRFSPPLTGDELPGWQVPGQELSNRKRNDDIAVALGAPIADRRFSIGIGGSLSFFNHDRQGKGMTGNMTAGMGFRPSKAVTIGVSGRNLLPFADPTAQRPLEILGGLWLGNEDIGAVMLEGGARPESEHLVVLGAGLEFTPNPGAAVRTGWRWEEGDHQLSLGGGLGAKEGSVDLAIAVPLDHLAKPLDWTAMISLRFAGPDPDRIQPN